MLSYRHAFHAGNHADVLKHCVLLQLLRHFNEKEKAYWVIDTHAGAGSYRLDSDQATKNREFADGIARLWERTDLPPALADYVGAVRAFNGGETLRRYPGSPRLCMQAMRAQDRLRLFELHSSDAALLRKEFARAFPKDAHRFAIVEGDGFASIKSVLPPPPRRGLVLMDPAYEDKRDYLRAVAAMKEALGRFATGTYALWYPQLPRGEWRMMLEKLKKLDADRWLHATLVVKGPGAEGFGMHGSGLFVINPPWTLRRDLEATLPFLAQALAQDEAAAYELESKED
jgi:23S rRNA (adenine2030-N6)-methyltransferase